MKVDMKRATDWKVQLAANGIRQNQMSRDLDLNVGRLNKIFNGWVNPKPGEVESIDLYLYGDVEKAAVTIERMREEERGKSEKRRAVAVVRGVVGEIAASGVRISKALGITQRMMIHMAETLVVVPSIGEADGKGTRRVWSVEDVRRLLLATILNRMRLPVRQIGTALERWADIRSGARSSVVLLEDPSGTVRLIIDCDRFDDECRRVLSKLGAA